MREKEKSWKSARRDLFFACSFAWVFNVDFSSIVYIMCDFVYFLHASDF